MQPYDCFPAKDGWVVIATVGSVFDRVCRVIGLDPDEDDWRSAIPTWGPSRELNSTPFCAVGLRTAP